MLRRRPYISGGAGQIAVAGTLAILDTSYATARGQVCHQSWKPTSVGLIWCVTWPPPVDCLLLEPESADMSRKTVLRHDRQQRNRQTADAPQRSRFSAQSIAARMRSRLYSSSPMTPWHICRMSWQNLPHCVESATILPGWAVIRAHLCSTTREGGRDSLALR